MVQKIELALDIITGAQNENHDVFRIFNLDREVCINLTKKSSGKVIPGNAKRIPSTAKRIPEDFFDQFIHTSRSRLKILIFGHSNDIPRLTQFFLDQCQGHFKGTLHFSYNPICNDKLDPPW